MSGYIEGTKYIEYTERTGQQTVSAVPAQNANSSIQIFNANLPKSQQTTQVELVKENTQTVQRRNLDISELTDKYEDNPIAVLKELGIEFSDKQIAELEKTLKDKKHFSEEWIV